MKKMLMNWAGCGAVALLMTGTARAEVLLFNLADVKLSDETEANTFILKYNNTSASLTADGSTLAWDGQTSNGKYTGILSYFDSVTLAVGETLKLDYTFTTNDPSYFNTSASNFRVYLLNSNGGRITDDISTAVGDNIFNTNGYRGYVEGYNPRLTVNNPGSIQTKYKAGANVFSTDFWGTVNSPTFINPNSQSITGSFAVERTAEGLVLTSIVNGTTISVDVLNGYNIGGNNAFFDTFDTFGFFSLYGGTAGQSLLTFNNLSVILIPEPSVTFLLATGGAILLALMAARRKRRCGC
ncbi:MAG: PEP-CTERM sorting domain-containing protein [Verrucomicrobiales bacterium]|jgi:hypothetical protein|nr:PEP-CTERM sorting domain-containing protein [Verrucomicrobiales bacterium]